MSDTARQKLKLILLNVVLCSALCASIFAAWKCAGMLRSRERTIEAITADLRAAKTWNHPKNLEAALSWQSVATVASLPIGDIREGDFRGVRTISGDRYDLSLQASKGSVYTIAASGPLPSKDSILSANVLLTDDLAEAYPCLSLQPELIFCISENGYRLLGFAMRLQTDWVPSAAIHSEAKAINQLAILMEGEDVFIFINRKQVYRIEKAAFRPESFGLAVFYKKAGYAHFIFDGFSLRMGPRGGSDGANKAL